MIDRTLSEILEAQQYFVGCFADLADCLQARGRQHVMNACRKSNVFDWRVVRKLGRRIDQMSFAHFAFSPSFTGRVVVTGSRGPSSRWVLRPVQDIDLVGIRRTATIKHTARENRLLRR